MEPHRSDRPIDVTAAPWLDVAADVVTVRGPDALAYLQSQVSQELRDQQVGERRWTFVLAPTGKVECLARVERTGDDTFELRTDPGAGEGLVERLRRFRIRVDAEIELDPATEPVPEHLEQARIEGGWPRMGAEIHPGEQIPAETGVTPLAVNFRKGCYPGQELVERMDSRGADAPRSLRRLAVEPGAAPGDPVVDDHGVAVGVVTSVAGAVALGYVKRNSDVGERIVHG